MDARAVIVESKRTKELQIKIIPGHFATSHSHVNYYIDMTSVKTKHLMAKNAARELAGNYINTAVDTIVCLDGTEIIGAFLANELSKAGLAFVNSGQNIAVITPEINSFNQMIFRDNIQKQVWNKNVLLLVASITTGKTVNRALDCVRYYGGKTAGICALFTHVDSVQDVAVNGLFDGKDIPKYENYSGHDCPFCKEGRKIDALINSYGYSKL